MTLKDVMDCESDDKNFKVDFKILTSKFGKDYISFCQAMWFANENVLSEEEFCKLNGNIPKGFFDKLIKKV